MTRDELLSLKRRLDVARGIYQDGDIWFDNVKALKSGKNTLNAPHEKRKPCKKPGRVILQNVQRNIRASRHSERAKEH